MDCSPPGSSIHGLFQARGLEWGATAFSAATCWGRRYWNLSCHSLLVRFSWLRPLSLYVFGALLFGALIFDVILFLVILPALKFTLSNIDIHSLSWFFIHVDSSASFPPFYFHPLVLLYLKQVPYRPRFVGWCFYDQLSRSLSFSWCIETIHI